LFFFNVVINIFQNSCIIWSTAKFTPPPPPPDTGDVREKIDGQQYTSKVPFSMGATVHKLGRKYQPMSECISTMLQIQLIGQF
jgi:hypothetical protein